MEQHDAKPGMNMRQTLAIVVMDVLMLTELVVSLYLASRQPDEFTPVFMKTFFAMLAPTLLAGLASVRLFRARPQGLNT